MKKIFTCICSFLISSSLHAEDDNGVFDPPPPIVIDRSKDKESKCFLNDTLLTAFDEKRLDNGTNKPVLRITILRSFDAPLMFKWFPSGEGKGAVLHIKKLKVDRDTDGSQVYKGLDTNKQIKLSEAQERLLKHTYHHSPVDELPQPFWQPDSLDGSVWIYELAAQKGSILIARQDPIAPNEIFDNLIVDPKRLAREMQLTTFTLMLWALSGIDEKPY